MFKLTFFLFIFSIVSILSQVDTLDTIVLTNGKSIEGKVLKIKNSTIELIEASSLIIYEYEKNKINLIKLSSGKTIQITETPTTTNEQPTVNKEEQVDKDTLGAQLGIGGGLLLSFSSDNFENGTGATLVFELRSSSIIAVRADFGFYSADTKVDYLSKGNSSFYMIELSLMLRSMVGSFQPYGGVGVGYYFIDNSLDSEVIQYLSQFGFGATEEIDNNIGFAIRGGFDLMLSRTFGFFGELKYWIYNPVATSTVYQLQNPNQLVETEAEIKLNNFNLILGLKIIL